MMLVFIEMKVTPCHPEAKRGISSKLHSLIKLMKKKRQVR